MGLVNICRNLFLAALCSAAVSCGSGGGSSESNAKLSLPDGFPIPNIPENNPITAEKIKLGRHLFYDKKLSGNGSQSCGSCHQQSNGFASGDIVAVGSTGELHPRNSSGLTNAAYNSTLTWANPNLLTIERQVLVPLFSQSPIELGAVGKEDEILSRFKGDPVYYMMFSQAFPDQEDPISFNSISFSISSFVRTLISGNSPYDKFVAGDSTQLSDSAKRGIDLFNSERLECHHCHGGFNFTLSTSHTSSQETSRPFHNTGLYNIGGTGAYPGNNHGIFEFSNEPSDMGKFRAPSLRNVEMSAPYMHDGSIGSLEDVIRFYEAGGRNVTSGPYRGDGRKNPFKSGFITGFKISDSERDDLLAFLRSLTDMEFLQNPDFSDPNN